MARARNPRKEQLDVDRIVVRPPGGPRPGDGAAELASWEARLVRWQDGLRDAVCPEQRALYVAAIAGGNAIVRQLRADCRAAESSLCRST